MTYEPLSNRASLQGVASLTDAEIEHWLARADDGTLDPNAKRWLRHILELGDSQHLFLANLLISLGQEPTYTQVDVIALQALLIDLQTRAALWDACQKGSA